MILSPRWIIFIGMALVLCSIVANIIEAADPLSADDVTIFSVVHSFQTLSSPDSGGLGIIATAIIIIPEAFDLLFKMLFWNYGFLQNFVGTIIRLLMFSVSFAILIWMALVFIKR